MMTTRRSFLKAVIGAVALAPLARVRPSQRVKTIIFEHGKIEEYWSQAAPLIKQGWHIWEHDGVVFNQVHDHSGKIAGKYAVYMVRPC